MSAMNFALRSRRFWAPDPQTASPGKAVREEEYADMIHQSSQHLLNLVNDLLICKDCPVVMSCTRRGSTSIAR